MDIYFDFTEIAGGNADNSEELDKRNQLIFDILKTIPSSYLVESYYLHDFGKAQFKFKYFSTEIAPFFLRLFRKFPQSVKQYLATRAMTSWKSYNSTNTTSHILLYVL